MPASDSILRRVVLATRNAGKVREFRSLLLGTGIEVLSATDFPGAPEVVEDGDTFRENALLKARALARHSGLVTVADDSGLEVDALDGSPGVRSARYAGDGATDADNNRKLLAELASVPQSQRLARFRCAVAVVAPSGEEAVVTGVCEGHVGFLPRGASGFGYDPVFLPGGGARTMAELDSAEKNAISHRGKAFREALPLLRTLTGTEEAPA